MSNPLQNTKIVPIIFPQVIADDADLVGGKDSTPVSVDTLGWNTCSIYVVFGSIDATAANMQIFESDDDSTYTAVSGLDFTSDTTAPGASDDNKAYAAHIALDGTAKRYLQIDLTAGNGAAGTYAVAFAFLSRGNEAPSTAAERGLADELFYPAS